MYAYRSVSTRPCIPALPVREMADSELEVILADHRHRLFDAALDEWQRRDEADAEQIARHYNRLGGRG